MTRDKTIKLARQAGAIAQQEKNRDVEYLFSVEKIERFAALVAAVEREACAGICCNQIHRWVDDRARYAASECAIGIRARGQS